MSRSFRFFWTWNFRGKYDYVKELRAAIAQTFNLAETNTGSSKAARNLQVNIFELSV